MTCSLCFRGSVVAGIGDARWSSLGHARCASTRLVGTYPALRAGHLLMTVVEAQLSRDVSHLAWKCRRNLVRGRRGATQQTGASELV
jgi:hypothetical protein